MEIVEFKKIFDKEIGVMLNDDYMLFENNELLNVNDGTSKTYNSFDEVLNVKINDKTIKEIIEEADNFDATLNGGRGAPSRKGAKLFTGGSKKGNKKLVGLSNSNGNSFPAYLNTKTGQRFKSQDKTIKEFAKMQDKSTIEYSASIDELGYATKYNKGDSGSTAFLSLKNGMLVHNHPVYDKKGNVVAWNSFSGQDLRAIAKNRETQGIVATANGNKSIYTFKKNKNFKAQEFIKGLSQARMGSSNYDKEVDSWLRKNAKKYGYTYSRKQYARPTTKKRK